MVIFKIIGKTIGFINQSIAAIGIAGGVAIAFTNVVARYAFDASLVWATEMTIFFFYMEYFSLVLLIVSKKMLILLWQLFLMLFLVRLQKSCC